MHGLIRIALWTLVLSGCAGLDPIDLPPEYTPPPNHSTLRDSAGVHIDDDPYFSDGMRLVVSLSADPLPYSDVRNPGRERFAAPVAESQVETAERNNRESAGEPGNGPQ